MGRTVGDKRPNLKPVQKIVLSEKQVLLRLVAVILLVIIGATALTHAITSLFTVESGWREIRTSSSSEVHCGDEFVFLYDLGRNGSSATVENKALTRLYTDALTKASCLYNNDASFEGMTNIYDINQHPNEILEVDTTLYRAFEKVEASGSRMLYLAPVYAVYDDIFFCEEDALTVDFDPYQNEELRNEFAETAGYARDPSHVQMELLGENKVRLLVSEEYAKYHEENYLTGYVDFMWMKNAFIIDDVAEVMVQNHFTNGYLSSYDGFIRNLDESDTPYAFDLYDRRGNTVYRAATMHYQGRSALVYLRDFELDPRDEQRFYTFADGSVRTPYLDERDGLCKNSVPELVVYSERLGCAELLLLSLPAYISETLDETLFTKLASENIFAIYPNLECESGIYVLYFTQKGLSLGELYEADAVSYRTELRHAGLTEENP